MQNEMFDIPEVDFTEITQQIEQQGIEGRLDSLRKLNLQEISDILEKSIVENTIDHAGLRANIIKISSSNYAITIQGSMDGGLLIKIPF